MNINAALTHIKGIKSSTHRHYAFQVFAYYRDYGKSQCSAWPHALAAHLPESTVTRINAAVRHYMVGDCDIRGNR